MGQKFKLRFSPSGAWFDFHGKTPPLCPKCRQPMQKIGPAVSKHYRCRKHRNVEISGD